METIQDKKGKTTLENHRTIQDEEKTLKNVAKKLVAKNKQIEKVTDYAIIPCFAGYLQVRLDKFKANEDFYRSNATGKIKIKKAGSKM